MEILEEGAAQQAPADRPRITTRYMTKYERARVLGTRALQIRCVYKKQLSECAHMPVSLSLSSIISYDHCLIFRAWPVLWLPA